MPSLEPFAEIKKHNRGKERLQITKQANKAGSRKTANWRINPRWLKPVKDWISQLKQDLKAHSKMGVTTQKAIKGN